MAYATWSNLLDDFMTDFPVVFRDDFNKVQTTPRVPVNVTEKEGAFQLEVIAPGFEKGDFKVSLEKEMLTISAEKKMEKLNEKDRSIRREYSVKSFKRSFTIDHSIDAKEIDAQYVNGVLMVQLPKRKETKQITTEIVIK